MAREAAELFLIDRHATPGRYPERLESIGGLDEFSLAPYLPPWSSVLKKRCRIALANTHTPAASASRFL